MSILKIQKMPKMPIIPAYRLKKKKEVDANDYNNLKSKFYKQHFRTPKDYITKRFATVLKTQHYQNVLTPTILKGLCNFQEKTNLCIKRVPLYSKLVSGEYQKGFANYDKSNTKASIDIFVQLPSFTQYQNRDELDWIVRDHRLLALEIFEHYKNGTKRGDVSLSTLEARFNSILRIIRIAYNTKKIPLYKLFSVIVFQIHGNVMDEEGENKLNQHEQEKFINWNDIMKIQSILEAKFNAVENKDTIEAYDLNNDLVLLSLYCLIPPLRNEIKLLEFTSNAKLNKIDYIYVSANKKKLILKLNKNKKQHAAIHFNLTLGPFANTHLCDIIIQSLTLYPRKYVFTLKNAYPDMSSKATQRAVDERLIDIFYRNGIKNMISVNSLRSSYVSHRLSEPRITYNQKKTIVYRMRTSLICLERSYNKVQFNSPVLKDKELCDMCDDCDDDIPVQPHHPDVAQPAPADDTRSKECNISYYHKKLEYNKNYYEAHKEDVLKKQKEYKDKKTPFEKTRERTVQLLNSSTDYAKSVRKTTLEKYKIYFHEDDAKWKWQE
jgi:hypothetical protein